MRIEGSLPRRSCEGFDVRQPTLTPAVVEGLEQRRLMSVVVDLANGNLTVTGDIYGPRVDRIHIYDDGTRMWVKDLTDDSLRWEPLGEITRITVDVKELGDSVYIQPVITMSVYLYGGPGADTLTGASGGDYIWGGGDNDIIDGAPGADQIRGEGGNDYIRGDAAYWYGTCLAR